MGGDVVDEIVYEFNTLVVIFIHKNGCFNSYHCHYRGAGGKDR
jgi:hypothetical protein